MKNEKILNSRKISRISNSQFLKFEEIKMKKIEKFKKTQNFFNKLLEN